MRDNLAFFSFSGVGYGYKKLTSEHILMSSLLDESVPDPTPMTLPVEVRLAEDFYVHDRYLEIIMPDPKVISGLEITTSKVNYLQSFELKYVEMATLFPNRYKHVELVTGEPLVRFETKF